MLLRGISPGNNGGNRVSVFGARASRDEVGCDDRRAESRLSGQGGGEI